MAFKIIRNDIKNVSADAVVRASEPEDSAVGTGQAVYEEAFGFNAKYLIRTACPARAGMQRQALQSCYDNCLGLAKKLGCESVAFPLFTEGADALLPAISSFRGFLEEYDMEIILAVPAGVSLDLSGGIFSGVDTFVDENYVPKPQEDEECFDSSAEGMAMLSPAAERQNRRPFKKPLHSLRRKGSAGEASAEAVLYSGNALPVPSAMGAAMPKPGRSLDDLMAHVAETWQESLLRLIDEKGFTDTEVYKRANIDRKLFSKIRSNPRYQPKKITAVAFALALCLSLDEAKDLLGRAGYAFSPSSRFDLIIEYFIENEVYDTYTINLALFEHDQPLLGE